MALKSKSDARSRRHARLRKKVVGTEAASAPRRDPLGPPRLRPGRRRQPRVTPSRRHPPSRADLRSFDGDKTAKARKVGELVAERAKAAGVEDVVFDRGGNRYAGRVAAIADGAREGGLNL